MSPQETALDHLPPQLGGIGGAVDYATDGPASGLPRLGSFSEFREMEAALPGLDEL